MPLLPAFVQRIDILEFSCNTSNERGAPMQPGRILEMLPSTP